MAIYHLHTEPASRSNGKSAVAMAAYRCGGRLIDDRTGEIKDYSRKQGIIQTALFYPDGVGFDRQTLWNMAESAEKRKDSRVAREIRIAIPHELEPEARIKLVNDFSLDLVNRYGIAVDASIHDPDRQGDNRNYHAHLLLTTRQISQDGLGEKSDLERSDKALKLEGKISTIQQIKDIREEWENLCNVALERQGREERISAKSYRAREIDQQPTIHIGPAATAMDRRGVQTRKVILNRAIRKHNASRRLVRRLGRVRREMELTEREIRELKCQIGREESQVLHPDFPPREEIEIRIGEGPEQECRQEARLGATQREPEKEPLTAAALLERHRQQKSLDEVRGERYRGGVEELLNRNRHRDEKSIKRDYDGIER